MAWLEAFAHQVPVAWFVFFGAMLEEVVAPIPSPLVMTLAGSVAASQHSSRIFLFLLALIGSFSKTIGSYIVYLIADKIEDVVVGKFGKIFGVSRADTEGLGVFLSKGWRDDIAIFFLRALPVIPTAPVSVVAGVVKMNLKTYLLSTFFGLVVRNSIYLYLGYVSLGTLESLSDGFDSLETIGYLVLIAVGGLALFWRYRQHKEGSALQLLERGMDRLKKLFTRDT